MSLKGFHIFFITVASLFCFAFGGWVLLEGRLDEGVQAKVFGGVSLVVGCGLALYAVYFYRKSKNIIV